MKDKEIVNISTKAEQEEREKRGKEKDKLIQELLHYATAEASGGIKFLIDCEGCAFYLYEILGYRKIDKDSVVLSREEYENLKQNINSLNKQLIEAIHTRYSEEEFEYKVDKAVEEELDRVEEEARKETAKNIYKLADNKLDLYRNGVIGGSLYDSGYQTAIYDIKRIIKKKFGVEIKE